MSQLPEKYHAITKKALIAAAGCGPLGVFSSAADVASIAGVWGTYLYSAARLERVEMTKESAVQICKTVLLGAAGYYAGCKMATRLFMFIPFAGPFMGMGISSLTNVLFTYRFALTVSAVFSQNGGQTAARRLAEQILAMLRGNGTIQDVKEIAHLWMKDTEGRQSGLRRLWAGDHGASVE